MQNRKDYSIVLFDIFTTGHHGYYALELSKYLHEKGIQVIFVTFKDERTQSYLQCNPYWKIEYIGGNPHLVIKDNFLIRNIQIFFAFKKCVTIAKKYGSRIIHVLYLDHNVIPLLGASIIKKNRVCILGTLFWPYFIKSENKSLFHKIYYWLTKILLKFALKKNLLNILFVHSENIKQLLEKELILKNKNTKKLVVVPDPSLNFYHYCTKEDARAALGFPQHETILLYFGVLSYEKGLDLLLNAIEGLNEKFKLVIAGRPTFFDESFIENFKNSLYDKEKIISHIDYIPPEKVPLYFLAADAVILPYRKSFLGTSGVLQQACGSGKPVIASDVGEIGNVVKKHNLGIIVEPESIDSLREGIKKFLKEKEIIYKLVQKNALNYAKENSAEKMAEKTYHTYLYLLNKK